MTYTAIITISVNSEQIIDIAKGMSRLHGVDYTPRDYIRRKVTDMVSELGTDATITSVALEVTS